MTNKDLKIPKSKKSEQYNSVINLKFLSVSSMNTLLAILKVTDARRDVILPGGPPQHTIPYHAPCAIILGRFEARFQIFG